MTELTAEQIEREWEIFAYHEAGHTVAYFIMGYPPIGVRIGNANRDLRAGGVVRILEPEETHPKDALQPWPKAKLISLRSGLVGHHIVAHPSRWQDDHYCYADMVEVRAHIASILPARLDVTSKRKETSRLIRWGLQQGKKLLHTPDGRKAVASVAEALLHYRILQRDECVQVLKADCPQLLLPLADTPLTANEAAAWKSFQGEFNSPVWNKSLPYSEFL